MQGNLIYVSGRWKFQSAPAQLSGRCPHSRNIALRKKIPIFSREPAVKAAVFDSRISLEVKIILSIIPLALPRKPRILIADRSSRSGDERPFKIN